MADKTTTSSETLKVSNITPLKPKSGDAQILIKLAHNLSESYQMVKERQKRFYELNMKDNKSNKKKTVKSDEENDDDGEGEWQEVKNKLKRKKKMSTSLASVSDAVNQEKRTRIEGMQLNCRGKLQLNEPLSERNTRISRTAKSQILSNTAQPKAKTLQTQTPPQPHTATIAATNSSTPPPRLKRKLQENVLTIQKLNALGEQLRLEINELKSNLMNERNAVRILRAQNESETRKSKSEVKKLQNIIELMKKNNAQMSGNNGRKPTELIAEATSTPSLANHEIQRLTNEIQALKEAYKALEERKMINGDAERRKAADVREMKDAYEIRLTQLSKSAKIEISRLLEEIKSKDRNIGQLKKEVQVLQTRIQKEQNKSRNATTSQQAMKQTTNKPKKIKKKLLNETSTKENEHIPKDVDNKETEKEKENENKDTPNIAQDTNEMKNLKDLELFNNMKNLQNSVTINLVKPTVKVNSNSRLQSSKLKTLVNIFENENQKIQNSKNEFSKNDNSNSKNHFETNKSCDVTVTNQQDEQQQQISEKEFHSLPHDLKTHFINKNEGPANKTTLNTTTQEGNEQNTTARKEDVNEIMNDHHEYRTKDHGSDSDSAVSSAPPSLSPQPTPGNMQKSDIWQTIRTYTSDIEKLQKDVDALQKENENLNAELEMAKEQILENEKIEMDTAKNNTKMKSLLDRVQYLEEQERELLNECNELREQNELLEFRILELEDNNDKWSMPAAQQLTPNAVRNASTITQEQSVWNCNGTGRNTATSPNIFEYTNDELSQRIGKMLQELSLQDEHKKCLQQVLSLLTQQNSNCGSSSNGSSGPSSFNTNSSSDESNSFELVKSRISTSSVQSTSNSIHPIFEHLSNSLKSPKSTTSNYRIVATVPPYNSTQPVHIAPNNTPNESPRKSRTSSAANSWQSSSLSESGVFVESDFFSDASVDQNASTQTDIVDNEDQPASKIEDSKVPIASLAVLQTAAAPPAFITKHQSHINDPKRLQYYQDRLRVLENKLLVYESSGDLQSKRLSDRLQREIQLEKELHELRERVEYLESENAQLDEEKCEFEEAENDTRLRLQRLEIELEILSQRNVELELSKEALSAKYKDCRSECLILREDLSANETQLRNICEDKRKAKDNLEFLHSLLPLLIAYNLVINRETQSDEAEKVISTMGNVPPTTSPSFDSTQPERVYGGTESCCCIRLKEQIKCLQSKLRQCNERYQEAMESADTHWLDLELEYKEREKIACAKEASLKQKISRLEDILRADACAANEKIMQMEDTEKELKNCLRRIAKEHKDILNEHQSISHEYESCREEMQQLKDAMKQLNESLEDEKKRNKSLQSELCVLQKIHTDSEKRHTAELKTLQAESCCLRKEFQNCEVSNCELREEVATLEQEIQKLQCQLKCLKSKICELCDEIRTKEEMCQRLEAELKRSEGFCLSLEMDSSPSKRMKRCEVSDLKTASRGLCQALNNVKDCEIAIPQINCVARDVKRLAEALLCSSENQQEEVSEKEKEKQNEKEAGEEREDKEDNEDDREEVVEKDDPMEKEIVAKSENVDGEQDEMVEDENLERTEGGNDLMGVVIAGMAHVPLFRVPESMIPRFLNAGQQKKTIAEVPSELRKLTPLNFCASCSSKIQQSLDKDNIKSDHMLERVVEDVIKTKTKTTTKNKNRKLRRRFAHSASWMIRIRRIVSQMNSRNTQKCIRRSTTPSICQSEVLKSKISYSSFYSVRGTDDILELGPNQRFCDTDSTQTVVKIDFKKPKEHIDRETETISVVKVDKSAQVTKEELDTEDLLKAMPAQCRSFITLIKASVEHTNAEADEFNVKISERWKTDGDFRKGLDILRDLFLKNSNFTNESYEYFVSAITSLHILSEMAKPLKIPIFNQIENQINERLMNFHTRKMESEFVCNVYYPIKRPSQAISLTENIFK